MSQFVSTAAKRKSLLLVTFCALLFVQPAATPVLAEAGLEFWNKNCKKIYSKFKTMPKHKAFAVSNTALDATGQSCGASWGANSKAAAEAQAKRSCKHPQVAGSCRVTRSE